MPRVESPPGSNSASAIETFDRCIRKWAWRKLDGIEAPSNKPALFGNEVHGQTETWLTTGVPFDLTRESGECALAQLHILPKPGTPGMLVEEPFILNAWGHVFFGYKDIELRVTADRPVPLVWDHKTSGNPAFWYTVETLPDNYQAALYAAHAMVVAGTDECDLVWSYIRTRKPYKSFPVRVRVTRKRIEPTLARIRVLAQEMRLIRESGLKALDLPFNPSECEAFGGCAYISQCNLTADDRMKAIFSMSVSEEQKKALLAKLQAKTGAVINPPAGAPPAPSSVQLSPDGMFQLDPATNSWVPVQAAPPPPPPPAAAPPPPPPPAVVAPTLDPSGQFMLVNNQWVPYTVVATPPAPPPPPAQGTPAPPAPKKRGRPKKDAVTDDGSPLARALSALSTFGEALEELLSDTSE